jgi:mannose-6-phosphate isomerase
MIKQLTPFISRKIWGGLKLEQIHQGTRSANDFPIGETWEVSTHPEGESFFKDSGEKLGQLLNLNFLIKFIDTGDDLSVQVHPGDEYALLNEGQKGKSECWLILSNEPGAGIYLGLKPGVNRHHLKEALDSNQAINEYLQFYPVKSGDFYYVPAGSIHAIGRGVTLVEIQQNSGVTYRFWDWNRLENGKPRQLHVKKSFDVLIDDADKNTQEYFCYQNDILNKEYEKRNLLKHTEFEVHLYNLKNNSKKKINLNSKKHYALVVLDGSIKCQNMTMNQFESFIILNEKELDLDSLTGGAFLLVE